MHRAVVGAGPELKPSREIQRRLYPCARHRNRLVHVLHFFALQSHPARGKDGGGEGTSDRALKVAGVEAAGTADTYALGVNETASFFLAAGVLCQAETGDRA